MANYELIATAAMGLEALVANEVRSLGYECTVENGRITFIGDERRLSLGRISCLKMLNFL